MIGTNFPLLELAGNNLWQSFIILAVVLTIFKLITKSSAEERSWGLSATLFVLAILPFAAFLPGEGISLEKDQPVTNYSAYEYKGSYEYTPVVTPEKKVLTELPLEKVELPTVGKNELVITAIVLWFVGTMIALFKLASAAFNASHIKASAYPYVMDEKLSKAWPENIEVAMSDEVTSPIVIGFIKPLIILPSRFVNSMTFDQLKPLLYHELAHVKRFDNCFYLIERIILALYWWNPAMHYIAARLSEERELACDDRAALDCGDQVEFAKSLLTGAKHLIGHNKSILGLAALRRESVLSKRVKRMTNGMTLKGIDVNRFAKNVISICLTIAVIGLMTPRFNESQAQETEYSEQVKALLELAKLDDQDGLYDALDGLPDEAVPEFTEAYVRENDLSRNQYRRLANRIYKIEDEDIHGDAMREIIDEKDIDPETRKMVIGVAMGKRRVMEIRDDIRLAMQEVRIEMDPEKIRAEIEKAIADLPTEEIIAEMRADIEKSYDELPTAEDLAQMEAEIRAELADLPDQIDIDVEEIVRSAIDSIDIEAMRADIKKALEDLPTRERVEAMKEKMRKGMKDVMSGKEVEEIQKDLEQTLSEFPDEKELDEIERTRQ